MMPYVVNLEGRIEAAVVAPYTRVIRHDPSDGGYSAYVLELPGVFGGGETAQEANDSLDESIRLWVGHELQAGREIPAPFDPEGFSGRVTLRMTPFLHERAQVRAAIERVSLNRLLEIAISTYLGERVEASAAAGVPEMRRVAEE
jgi:predicted RNase H-like HicB family nuclease